MQKTADKTKNLVEERRLRIKIKAYDHRLADNSARQIVDAVLRQGVNAVGPIPLPTEIKKFTVNRSTFVHKDAREQFEMRIHKRIVDVLNPTPKIIDSFQNLNLPAGVDVEIKM
jgi:small subunit ribosomal protein S10